MYHVASYFLMEAFFRAETVLWNFIFLFVETGSLDQSSIFQTEFRRAQVLWDVNRREMGKRVPWSMSLGITVFNGVNVCTGLFRAFNVLISSVNG